MHRFFCDSEKCGGMFEVCIDCGFQCRGYDPPLLPYPERLWLNNWITAAVWRVDTLSAAPAASLSADHILETPSVNSDTNALTARKSFVTVAWHSMTVFTAEIPSAL